jgi:predicted PurR-regulated permease PerM
LSVLGCLVLALWLTSVAVIPVIQKQAEQFISDLPTLSAQVQDLTINGVGVTPQSVLETGGDYLSSHVTLSSVLDVSRSITEAVSLSIVAFIVTVYLVIHPTLLIDGFVSLFPAERREKVRDVLGKMYHAVQKWFLGQLSAMVIIGVLTAVALSIIGLPYALLTGAFSGILAFITLIGGITSVSWTGSIYATATPSIVASS